MGRRRRGAIALASLGVILGGACIVSEFVGVAWWSPVRLTGAKAPGQDYVALARGEIRVGFRSTAGFFTRAIMNEGWWIGDARAVHFEPPTRSWIPRRRIGRLSDCFAFPLAPPAILLLGAAAYLRWRTPRDPAICPACGYDLRGLPAGRCPECGVAGPAPAH
jgi:hypothetical protein